MIAGVIPSERHVHLAEQRWGVQTTSDATTAVLQIPKEQSFVSGLTGYLSGLYADRIDQSGKGEECDVTLLFRL